MSVRVDIRRDEALPEVSSLGRGLARRDALSLASWCALVLGVALWGRAVNESYATNVLAPPLFGRFDLRVGPATLLCVAVAGTIIWFGPRAARRLPWRSLLVATTLAASLWAVSLALVDGAGALTAPLSGPHDYLVNVDRIESVSDFLAFYVEDLGALSLHAQGHPPGMTLIFWALAHLGLGGAVPATVLVLATGVSAAAATMITVRATSDEPPARRLAPFFSLSPAAIWIATSADAFFMGVSAWGIALLALGARRRSDPLNLAAGGLLGLSLFLSYGVMSLGAVALAVVLVQRRVRPLVVAAAGVAAVVAVFAATGFWWPDGLSATVGRYEAGVASQRPFGYFVVANLGAFALALGPAVAVGLGRLRGSPASPLVLAALVAVAAANVSGLSKGEVERIWLILLPWVLAACASFELRRARGMLVLQSIAALAIQTGVRTPW
ncbi:MAG: hypothetical protein ACRDK3_15910 [Actinomycetota bacterium]